VCAEHEGEILIKRASGRNPNLMSTTMVEGAPLGFISLGARLGAWRAGRELPR